MKLNEKPSPHEGLEPPTSLSLDERSTSSTTTALSGGSPILGGQHCSTPDYIAGQSFPLAVTVLPGLCKPGHGSAHDARRAAPVDRVWESGPRRGRDLAGVRGVNKPSGGVRPAEHTTACVGYQWTSNFLSVDIAA